MFAAASRNLPLSATLAAPRAIDAPEQAPPCSGAYVLVIDLDRPLAIALPGRDPRCLPPGRYLYCGSARGPGGLKARLARHMRRGKRRHWHVDLLTEAGRVAGAWIVPGGDECALVAALSHLPMPISGFGSSDCRRCRSHLLLQPTCAGARLVANGNETALPFVAQHGAKPGTRPVGPLSDQAGEKSDEGSRRDRLHPG
jgi:Uri superfamily endonuclease